MKLIVTILILLLCPLATFAAGGDQNPGSASGRKAGTAERGEKRVSRAGEKGVFHLEMTTGGGELRLGPNEVDLVVMDKAGNGVEGADIVVTPWMPEMGHGVWEKPVVTGRGGGKYHVENVMVIMPGHWELRLAVNQGDRADRAVFSFDVIDTEQSQGAEKTHKHDHLAAGGEMLFNPAFGDDIYHTHPAGTWMANYKFMHTSQNGLRSGTHNVPASQATPVGNKPFGYMMAPTGMTMDMHMVMVMYGLTDRLSLMGMGTWQENRMDMVMNMGMGAGNEPAASMRTGGVGDTEVRGIYAINDSLAASLGIGIPTGDIRQSISVMGTTFRAPYDMQLGSGTVDLKPALTYNVLSDDRLWNWGGQGSFTYHVDHNENGYSLGDSAKATGWLQRSLGPAAAWLRLAYTWSGRINGRDPEIGKLLDPVMGAPTPDADPGNYGGHRFDGFIGASVSVGRVSLGVEGGVPLYQNLNGLQLKNDWYVTAGVQAVF